VTAVLVFAGVLPPGKCVEGRRRLVLLAVIIVAVAIGAVGLTLMSLFEANVEQQQQQLERRLAAPAASAGAAEQVATLVRQGTQWHAVGGVVAPLPVQAVFSAIVARNPAIGSTYWDYDDDASVRVGVRFADSHTAHVAWLQLDDLRAPFHRAALQAAVGLLVLLALGIALFYRMTTPLLRSIEASEVRYRTLFSSTAEGVLLIGERIEECNDRACDMLGVHREDVLGMPWREFFLRVGGSGQRLAEFEARVVAALEGRSDPFNWEFPARTGAESPLVVEIALRRLGQGVPAQVLASLRDVSYREEAGRALRLAERTLRESREKLAQAGRSSALVELAAGFAHEVNQPLAAIANYAQASRRLVAPGQPCPPDVAAALDRIAEQAHRAGDAIHRIRGLVDASPRQDQARTCINQLVNEVVALMRDEIDAAGARVRLGLADDMVPILADPLQIQQVLVQLLRNALESVAGVPAEQRDIAIATRVLGEQVEVSVSDHGQGVSPDDQQRIFEPFFSTREGGMGMGLAISLSIIRSSMGELEFDPAVQAGACFRFRLPADASHEGSEKPCRDTVAP
jgi:PAS domain S-box-containing protein